jgi:hypothetical protein
MAGHIDRTAGPQPIREQPNGEFAWTIPLSGAPSREWLKLFNTPAESEGACMPSLVDFRDRGMIFTAREEKIREWMQHIDRWIATANAGVGDAEAKRSHAREREERGVEAARQRVTDADKYRRL